MAAKSTFSDDAASSAGTAAPSESVGRGLVAENMVKDYIMASMAASIVPVPLFDIAAVAGVQLRMIQKLSELYGKPFSESVGRNILASLVGGLAGYGVGVTVAVSLTKLIPGVGWMVGMVSLPVVAGASTYAVGSVFVKHYEQGGDIFDLSTDAMRSFYKQQFEKGKALAAKAKAKIQKSDEAVTAS
jgi:uncharacterized protein (DUF697 family)